MGSCTGTLLFLLPAQLCMHCKLNSITLFLIIDNLSQGGSVQNSKQSWLWPVSAMVWQQDQGRDHPPVLDTGEATTQILCSVLGSPLQEGHWGAAECSEQSLHLTLHTLIFSAHISHLWLPAPAEAGENRHLPPKPPFQQLLIILISRATGLNSPFITWSWPE